ncbi:MAG TPA: bifunctional glutamate N-acetyltransferase/amino-acid acetyltransferase ArgJ [Candidatus Acidoferrum sp.]|nr:bifunctional glutamate N-acetyltransferase/amino-acid acetyltransferase ArgJ [Candidatus Acidoferrum sp.]
MAGTDAYLFGIPGGISAVKGVRSAGVACGIKREGQPDLALVMAEGPATVAATFTTNRVQAAPVQISRGNLRGGKFSAIVLNSGNANACTGRQGLADAKATVLEAARVLKRPVGQVFVASTGVIGRRLDMAAIRKGIAEAASRLDVSGGSAAARAILTTDTTPKEAAISFVVKNRRVTIGGMAKGSGMIAPRMATLLAVIATDASVAAGALQQALKSAVDATFNCITVDGDTSTNDMTLCFATGASGVPALHPGTASLRTFQIGLEMVCLSLAKMLVRDGEGATKLVEVRITGAHTAREARLAAEAVATSPLVKTTLFGEDINWGRVLAAVGRSGAHFDPARVDLSVDELAVVRRGMSLGSNAETAANHRMQQREFALVTNLHAGRMTARLWTTDLSEGYVRINAGYRS